ncbi:MAG: HD domain-containing protein, partial [Clostridia bacterium]|nr:HD domain-containing protein [Clostridia bacterium]
MNKPTKRQEMLRVFENGQIFHELMAALSMALDMDARGKLYHAWRVALVAAKTAEIMLPDKVTDVFYAGLLHDIGAMGLDDHIVHQMISGEPLTDPIILEHSNRGAAIAKELPALAEAAQYILEHHEHWDGTGTPAQKSGPSLSLGGQIVAIADQLDILLRLYPLDQGKKALEIIKSRAGSSLMPEVVEAFLAAVAETPYYYQVQDYNSLTPLMTETLEKLPPVDCVHPQPFKATVRVFARIIDAKHKYTSGHSQRVAYYGVKLAREIGFTEEQLEELEVAGLLHDFGKISVPNRILDKAGPLDDDEFAIIRQHPGRTAELLNMIDGLKHLAWIAAGHHERYDGKGYPLKLGGEEIPLGARILSV